jgi:hypothetical protein
MTVILPGQTLPTCFKFQQKYYDSLTDLHLKEQFAQNLLTNRKNTINSKIAELQAISSSRVEELNNELKPYLPANSPVNILTPAFLLALDLPGVLDNMINVKIMNNIERKLLHSKQKEDKQKKFQIQKEKQSNLKAVTIKEFDDITRKLKQLQVQSKNINGRQQPSSKSPTKAKQQKEKKSKNKRSNGSTTNTATKGDRI